MTTKAFRTALLAFSLFLAALLPLSSTSGGVASHMVYDDFEDDSTDSSLWTASQGPGVTIAEINQRLEIAFSPTAAGSSFGAGYSSACLLRGDFDIQVGFQLLSWPSTNGVRVGLKMGGGIGTTERVSLGASGDFPGQPREAYVTHYADGVSEFIATDDLSGKLRVVREGNAVTGYYFSEGDWVSIHTGPATTADVSFSLSSWSHDYAFADQTVKLAFDNVVVNDGQLICEDSVGTFRCGGKAATIVGTSRDDRILGTPGADVIVALGGNDVILALGGSDVVCGGLGNDVIMGGSGRDRLLGGLGHDMIDGGRGPDRIFGGFGNDMLAGRGGRDTIKCGPGIDFADGGPHLDTAASCELEANIP